MAQRKAARLKKLSDDESDLSKRIQEVDSEIQVFKGLSEPPKIDEELMNLIEEP